MSRLPLRPFVSEWKGLTLVQCTHSCLYHAFQNKDHVGDVSYHDVCEDRHNIRQPRERLTYEQAVGAR